MSDLQRNRWRTTTGSKVKPDVRLWRKKRNRGQGLDQQTVDGRVGRRLQRQAREVDRAIPAPQKSEIGLELLGDFIAKRHMGQLSSLPKQSADGFAVTNRHLPAAAWMYFD